MTRRERLERKLEKREEWAEGRQAKAEQAFGQSHEAVAAVPFGQPILIGHHSEGKHRSAIKRSNSAMQQGVESLSMAELHASKTAGISRQLATSIYSDDPDAIEALTAKVAKLESERERIKSINKIIRRKPKNEPTPEKLAELAALAGSEVAAGELFKPDFAGRIGIPSYVLQNLGGNIPTAKKRIDEIRRRNTQAKAAEAAGGVLVNLSPCSQYATVTFAEKPDYSIIKAMKSAGFRWGAGSWFGKADALPPTLSQTEGA